MENVYEKLSNMLMAYYPIIYLTGYEYDITTQKIRSVIKGLSCETNIYLWNCATGLSQIVEKKTENGIVPDYLQIRNTENGLEVLRRIDSIASARGKAKDVYILEDEKITLSPDLSRYLSVFAISEKATVSITGAGYLLDNYVMERSFPIGVSNEFIEGADCTVEVKSGLAVVMTVKK